MFSVQRIAKNTMVLSISQIVSYILAFFYTIAIARYLGADDFGILSFALAFTGIFGILADLGLNTLAVKEIANDRSLTEKFLGNFLLIKIFLSIFTFLIIALIVNLLNYDAQTVGIVYLVALSVILSAISSIFNSIFQAYEKMEYQSLGQILNSVLMFIGVFFAILYGFNVLGFAFLYFIFSVVVLIYNILIYIWKFNSIKLEINLHFGISKIKEALPFGINGMFVIVYVWVDSVLLFIMQGNQAVGWYNAAYRIIIVLLFIQSASNIAVFPVMSQFYVNSKSSLKKLVEKYFKFMLFISIPLGIGVTLLAPDIIMLIFGKQYENSIITLQILIWSSVFVFLYTAFAQLFLSINKQITLTKISGICMVENILLNLYLIPKFSYIGASFVTVVTEFTILILIFSISNDIGYGISFKQLKDVIKVICSSLIMGIFIIFADLNIFIVAPMAILIYIGILFLTKAIGDEDLSLIKKVFKTDKIEKSVE